VQEMKDKGVDVPGVNDIQSPVSRRKRGSNIQPRPNTPTQESRGILSF
jgi:hypothetical protein